MKASTIFLSMMILCMIPLACGGGDDGDGDESNGSADVLDGDTGNASDAVTDVAEEIKEDTGPPAACACNVDADCDVGDICVNTEDGWACKSYPPQGLCWSDEHCVFGSVCEDALPCPCDTICEADEPGKCTEGSGCCAGDVDCFGGDVCVNQVCKASLPGKQCWGSEVCSAGEECVGANVCPCEAECPSEDTQGKCYPVDSGCCLTNADCPLGDVCIEDLCKSNPGNNQCWDDSHCAADETCEGENTCSCLDAPCANETVGTCLGSLDCCSTDAECSGIQVCLNGACHDPAGGSSCWTANDCVNPQANCVGAIQCACGVPCSTEQIGSCVSSSSCCNTDLDCLGGYVCVGDDCKQATVPGTCWSDDDCLAGQVCDGASACPCEAPCFQEDTQGTCKAVTPPGCCDSQVDCGPGMICLEGVCQDAPTLETCFSDTDCGANEICYGATICPCGANCVSDLGACEVAACCADTMPECSAGWICVPPHGCVPSATGDQCWHDQDCEGGQFCDGAFICGCTADCAGPDTPGTCASF